MASVVISTKSMSSIFTILTYNPVIFLLLLYLLETINTPNPQGEFEFLQVLTYGLSGVAVVELLMAEYIFIPRATKTEPKLRFAQLLIPVVLSNAVAIYGLFIGLLQLFVGTGVITWSPVLILCLTSMLYTNFVVTRDVKPWLAIYESELAGASPSQE